MSRHELPIVLGIALWVLLGAGAAHAEPVGFVAGLEGEVEVMAGDGAAWTAAALDATVSLGDTIRTGRDAAAKIVLVDDTTLSIGEETELVLDRFVVGPAATSERSVVKQLRGQVLTTVGEAFGGPTRLEVHTPTSVVGVKGTVLETRVRQETIACNHSGLIFVRSLDVVDAPEVEVPPGMCSRIKQGLPPEPPEELPRDFKPLGPGPSGSVAVAASGSGSNGSRGALFDAMEETPPVAAAGGDPTEIPTQITVDAESVLEDPVDAAAAAGNLSGAPQSTGVGPSVGGGEVPGNIGIGGGEAPGEFGIGGGEAPGEN